MPQSLRSETYAPRDNAHIPGVVIVQRTDTRKSRAPQHVAYADDISSRDKSAINRAMLAAKSSEHHKYRVGAAVLVSGRTTAASNRFRNAPHEAPPTEQSVHAEVRAVLRACSNGRGGTIYVARLGARGRLLPSHPCARCMPVLMEAGIKRVVWYDGLSWRSNRIQRHY
jgi:deoxycytidylate deaminase